MIVKVIKNTNTTIYTDVREHWVDRDPDQTAAEFTMKIRHQQEQVELVSLDMLQNDRMKTYTEDGVLLEDIIINLTYMPIRQGDL